ncbi:serine hydrolase [Pullulanibacillus sp. KACC 23026]|uniref:serine hydrolase domain-containing protein n=1 Tax=Pullulanibacillus sp. KACC 23026 TaxID=3028315 RepID=UPI0023AF42A2|nr:serine hydrolase domain-containing protein [Pullulanibacillus sp. KACC 23026]WEG14732.1 serine hydrolase [Pullulanibacillus sp. KACC 23026]
MIQTNQVDHLLQRMVNENQLPGAVYSVFNAEATLLENAIGWSHKDLPIKMTIDTVFDLASLTKVTATLPSILLLIEEGVIDLDDPIRYFYPEAVSTTLTIKHLLTHTSGLTWHIPFFKYNWTKEQVKKHILTSGANPGREIIYSDLNFILLGFLVEDLTGHSLDVFSRNNVFLPLDMNETVFNPKCAKERIAPTEFRPEKKTYDWGTVHDENAHQLGGVSGHAGLFATLFDLKKYVRMFLKQGADGDGKQFLSRSTIKTSQRNFTKDLSLNRGLGWQLVDSCDSPLGYFFSPKSFGHTGFTGTSIWIDPEQEIGLILLTNRVHISREVNMNRIRRLFHNVVASTLSK